MKLFKALTAVEESAFRQWARENYQPFQPISGLWHPVVQAECIKINADAELPFVQQPQEGA